MSRTVYKSPSAAQSFRSVTVLTALTPANHGQLSALYDAFWRPVPKGTAGARRDPLGGNSCVAYAAAYAVRLATHGRLHPSGKKIREWTGDVNGGLELNQVDRAITNHTDLSPMTGVFTTGDYEDYRTRGWVGVPIGGYAPIEASRYDAQPGFYRNHAICDPPDGEDMEPLADGRRSGIYRYHGEDYPRSLMHAFFAALRDSNGHNVGPNHIEAMLIRVEGSSNSTQQPISHQVVVSAPFVREYLVNERQREIIGRHRSPTGGFSADATGRFRFHRGTQVFELCQLLTGSRKGQWLNVNGDNVIYRRVA